MDESHFDEQATTFKELGASDWLVSTLKELGITRPTKVQAGTIPAVLSHKNVVGASQTGTGKTAAFALPLLQELSSDPYGIFAIVLTPTRELAMQIADQIRVFGAKMRARVAVVVGKTNWVRQLEELDSRPHFVVATPGRLAAHVRGGVGVISRTDGRKRLHLSHCRALVLDEADRLLTGTFGDDLRTIVDALPPAKHRSTLLFSATMSDEAEQKLAALSSGEPERFFRFEASGREMETVAALDQRYMFMPFDVKHCYLVHLLQSEQFARKSVIVFTATTYTAAKLHVMLHQLGIDSAALHSRMTQGGRFNALARFRSSRTRIFITTDVGSRGLDIPHVQLVVNYDLPADPRDYVHRVGRTARAGRSGMAISLVTQYDVDRVHAIETAIDRRLELFEHDEREALRLLQETSAAERIAAIHVDESGQFDDVVQKRVERNRFHDERRRVQKSKASKQASSSSSSSLTSDDGKAKRDKGSSTTPKPKAKARQRDDNIVQDTHTKRKRRRRT
jgi:ATP-dependent RNA helicase DDX49/DBP8